VAVRDGKLVVDLEVSPELVDPARVKYTDGEEFTKYDFPNLKVLIHWTVLDIAPLLFSM
jgi:hypothetical protein